MTASPLQTETSPCCCQHSCIMTRLCMASALLCVLAADPGSCHLDRFTSCPPGARC